MVQSVDNRMSDPLVDCASSTEMPAPAQEPGVWRRLIIAFHLLAFVGLALAGEPMMSEMMVSDISAHESVLIPGGGGTGMSWSMTICLPFDVMMAPGSERLIPGNPEAAVLGGML